MQPDAALLTLGLTPSTSRSLIIPFTHEEAALLSAKLGNYSASRRRGRRLASPADLTIDPRVEKQASGETTVDSHNGHRAAATRRVRPCSRKSGARWQTPFGGKPASRLGSLPRLPGRGGGGTR
jgi:hypothetical protein